MLSFVMGNGLASTQIGMGVVYLTQARAQSSSSRLYSPHSLWLCNLKIRYVLELGHAFSALISHRPQRTGILGSSHHLSTI